LDVTATGAAGIDWGNVENKTTANDLSGTDIQLCDTVTTNSDMRGTDSAALASVCTETRLAELDAANLPTDIAAIPTTPMRGTDNAALASAYTAARAAYLDELAAANIPADVDTLLTRLSAARAGYLDELAAANLPADIDAILADTAVLGQRVTLTGTAAAGDTTIKITLTGGVATDNYYNGQLVVITGGTGAGQARTILNYLAAGTAATPTRDFLVAPDGSSTFIVIGNDIPSILEAGVATAGGASTITFDATASTTADIYKNDHVMITGGTGAGQTRLIGAYSAGRVATVFPNWTVTPDATSIYQVLPAARVDIQGWGGNLVTGDGDWAELQTDMDAILVDTSTTIPASIAALQADLPVKLTKNTAFTNFMFKMVDATDGYTAETGIAVTATRSLDGAAFAACANAATEVSNGWYKIDLDAADLNGDMVVLRFTGTGCRATEIFMVTQAT
jgi:hypothetical protein